MYINSQICRSNEAEAKVAPFGLNLAVLTSPYGKEHTILYTVEPL